MHTKFGSFTSNCLAVYEGQNFSKFFIRIGTFLHNKSSMIDYFWLND